uniref:Uncharacterized protein n=1 Tax=Tanacetum cinerariifolium TaxID=118510 RepID=A0A699J2U2_TANCI|nr:hypothetical protein [Tanacetum cinerariifolium]
MDPTTLKKVMSILLKYLSLLNATSAILINCANLKNSGSYDTQWGPMKNTLPSVQANVTLGKKPMGPCLASTMFSSTKGITDIPYGVSNPYGYAIWTYLDVLFSATQEYEVGVSL